MSAPMRVTSQMWGTGRTPVPWTPRAKWLGEFAGLLVLVLALAALAVVAS